MQNPPVLYIMPGTQQAGMLPQNLWMYYCRRGQAEVVLAAVKKVVIDATLTTDPYPPFIGGAQVLDPDVAMWRVIGTYQGNEVNEHCGDLFDRMTAPNNWVDKNGPPNYTVGGDQIHVAVYPPTYTELGWRAVASQPA